MLDAVSGSLPGDPQSVERIAGAVEGLGELRVLDHSVQRVLAICRDQDASTTELVGVLESDAPFAANLLRYANSAYAARPVRVRTIRQAVMMAGRVHIERLALETATYRFLERTPGTGRASIGAMQMHASAVAAVASELAQRTGAAVDVAHLAGLLHDLGKLVMPLAFGTQPLEQIAASAPAGPERVALEHERFGCDHALASATLADRSGLDRPVITAILAHHDPDIDPSPEGACVQLANALVGMLTGTDPEPGLLDHALGRLRLHAGVLDELAGRAGQLAGNVPTAVGGDRALAARIAGLELRATTDELTGLANRRQWKERARAALRDRDGAVLLCDIDRFKAVNDNNGHHTGDLVLCEIARILAHHGLAGRLGGDELVLLSTAPPDHAHATAQRIIEQVRDTFPPGTITGWNPGLSIGIALAHAGQHDISTLLAAADQALYEAKRAGRGRAVIAA